MINKKPVVFIFFNREETTKKVFMKIREYKPSKLYLVSDGARTTDEEKTVRQIRSWVENAIDWEVDIEKNYAEKNLGCKKRIVSGIDWVFETEEEAIIIEDDCLPNSNFFDFCSLILDFHKNDLQVMMISGNNLLLDSYYKVKEDYTFSRNMFIWGWATWKRAWKLYDPEMSSWENIKRVENLKNKFINLYDYNRKAKEYERAYKNEVDTWDFQWDYCIRLNSGLVIIPKTNLVINIGLDSGEATHPNKSVPYNWRKIYAEKSSYQLPVHKQSVTWNDTFDYFYSKMNIDMEIMSRKSLRKIVWRLIKQKVKKTYF